jgi:hypothetical protein
VDLGSEAHVPDVRRAATGEDPDLRWVSGSDIVTCIQLNENGKCRVRRAGRTQHTTAFSSASCNTKLQSASYLGYRTSGSLEVSADKPLTKAYFVKNRVGMSRVPDSAKQRLRDMLPEAIVRCRCLEQDWYSMGIEQFADFDSLYRLNQAISEFQEEHGVFWDAMTLLGREQKR